MQIVHFLAPEEQMGQGISALGFGCLLKGSNQNA